MREKGKLCSFRSNIKAPKKLRLDRLFIFPPMFIARLEISSLSDQMEKNDFSLNSVKNGFFSPFRPTVQASNPSRQRSFSTTSLTFASSRSTPSGSQPSTPTARAPTRPRSRLPPSPTSQPTRPWTWPSRRIPPRASSSDGNLRQRRAKMGSSQVRVYS